MKEAVNRGAVIVFMRREDMWQEAVPELKDYDRHSIFKVINTQNPVISPKNCPQGFENVVKAIETAEAKRRNP